MYRNIIQELIKWKEKENKKPLIIRGARQVGKTWIMQEFGKECYKQTAYINFDNNNRMKLLFEQDLDIERLIQGLEIETGLQITPKDTLIIFDEIQEVPNALKSLKYFYENGNNYDIIAAGSMLGVAMHQGTSFPVGKVDFLDLYPLNFYEFLKAMGEEKIVNIVKNKEIELLDVFHDKIENYLKQYMYVGGMPEVVNEYVNTKNLNSVREIQNKLLEAYEQDFSKHAPNNTVPRIRGLWNNIPTQLAKENKKFIYGLVREGARAREYEVALSWLIDCGLVYQINRVNTSKIPLIAYQDFGAFKLFILDVGLLCAMAGISVEILLKGNEVFEEFKGALAEQFVLCELKSNTTYPIFYWSSDRGSSELDYIIQADNENIPIEVKSGINLQAKSLKVFIQKYGTKTNVRTSMTRYKKEEWVINIPLYAIGSIQKYI